MISMAFNRVSAFVFVICALSALSPQSARAAPEAVIVRYDDIDAHSRDGVQTLLRRIERAASAVCGRDLALRYPAVRRAHRCCTLETMANVVDRIGAEPLHSAFVTHFGRI
jgi:UrcA family protein